MDPLRVNVWVALAVVLAALSFVPASAPARMSVVYDLRATLECLTAQGGGAGACPGTGLDPETEGLFQQQNAVAVIPARRQVGKVLSSPAAGSTSPSIQGLSALQMAEVFRREIDASGARMAFLDELDGRYRQGTADAANLRAAFAEYLSRWIDPVTGKPYAHEAHLYVRVPVAMFREPAGWADAWDALRLSGGAWVEAYTGRAPAEAWPDAETWLAFPRGFKHEFVGSSLGSPVVGDPARLHLLLTSTAPVGSTQARQWQLARTGASCGFLSNGPGAYRLSNGSSGASEARGFREEFRAGLSAPAVPGPRTLSAPWDAHPSTIVADEEALAERPGAVLCAPAPRLTDLTAPTAQALASVLAMEQNGTELPARLTVDGVEHGGTASVGTGRLSSVRVSLIGGTGIGERLGIPPDELWAAGARLTARGAGVETSVEVAADGTASLPVSPTGPGEITLTLAELPGAPLRRAVTRALGGASPDLALSVACASYRFDDPRTGEVISRPEEPCVDALDPSRHRETLTRVLAMPKTWSLRGIRLRAPSGEAALVATPEDPMPAVPTPAPSARPAPWLAARATARTRDRRALGAVRFRAPRRVRVGAHAAIRVRVGPVIPDRVILQRRTSGRLRTLVSVRPRARLVLLPIRAATHGRYRLRLILELDGARVTRELIVIAAPFRGGRGRSRSPSGTG